MTTRSVPDPIAYFEIHRAVCRARRQGLVCSTCSDLAVSYARAIAAVRLADINAGASPRFARPLQVVA